MGGARIAREKCSRPCLSIITAPRRPADDQVIVYRTHDIGRCGLKLNDWQFIAASFRALF